MGWATRVISDKKTNKEGAPKRKAAELQLPDDSDDEEPKDDPEARSLAHMP